MGSIVNLGSICLQFLKVIFYFEKQVEKKTQKIHLVLVFFFLKNIKNKKNTNFKEQAQIP